MVVPTSTDFSMVVVLQVSTTIGKSWVTLDGAGRMSILTSLRFDREISLKNTLTY